MSGGGDDRAGDLRRAMRGPLLTSGALLLCLGVNLALGWWQPFAYAWAAELAIMAAMIAGVLLFSMEVIEHPALIKLFSVLGFCWVAILFTMTLIDYVGR